MSNNLYSKKTVKSNVFLFPLLGTSRYAAYLCKRTYIICEDRNITEFDKKLIVAYPIDESEGFKEYERKILLSNKTLIEKITTGTEYLYIYDFSYLKDTWKKFLDGRYSKFPNDIKSRIMKYHVIMDNNVKKENRIIQEILYPENPTMTDISGQRVDYVDAFERYAPILGIDSEMLREVGEIYSRPDLKNETLLFKKLQEN